MHSRLKFSILNKNHANNSINVIRSRQRIAHHIKFHRKLIRLMWAEIALDIGITKRLESTCKMIDRMEVMYPHIYFQEV